MVLKAAARRAGAVLFPLVLVLGGSTGCARREVAESIADLSSEDATVRSRAAERLARLRSPASYEALLRASGDGDTHVRMWATYGLGALGNRRAFAPLTHRLIDDAAIVRMAAMGALASLGTPRCRDLLIQAMADSYPRAGICAALELSRFKDVETVRKLAEVALNPEDERQHNAVLALCEIGTPACEAHLLKVLRELPGKDRYVKARALEGLARIGSPTAVALVTSLALDPAADKDLRAGAAEAMVASGSKVYRPALLRVLQQPGNPGLEWALSDKAGLDYRPAVPRLCEILRADQSPWHREAAARHLRKTGDQRAAPALCAALADKEKGVRLEAVRALASVRAPEAVGPLLDLAWSDECFWDPWPEALAGALAAADRTTSGCKLLAMMGSAKFEKRARSALLLGLLGFREAIPRLRQALDDENWTVRCQAAEAVGRLGDRGSFDRLVRLAREGDANEQSYVCTAFEHLQDRRAIPVVIWLLETNGGNSAPGWALRKLVGPEGGEAGRDWHSWWEKNKAKWPEQ